MTVTSVETDHENLTVTVIADFDASPDRVWELWSNPRKLELWWGPPSYPATVEKHDLSPGGEVTYRMTGPEGETHHGLWRIAAADPPTSLEFSDVFASDDGTPVADMPVSHVTVRLSERGGGTRMEMRSSFDSGEDLERWLSTGTLEGQRQAVAQMAPLID